MYLKKIEVHGFKSFANKLEFEFNEGVTAIVGPNGSGKSNVADAVRWVLGEQSSKQLRGSNMQDVIFAGTENRKPLGFAYVAMTLDNSDHQLPLDFDEVVVSRRLYRSGESEYLLNGNTCRLKDIYELFYDTGIGKEGYSIIGQGQVDRILSGKPEERREILDEAAGIVKFKKRKAIAQKKLEDEQANLVRVSDILRELEKQVGPLERQSEKARQYLKLRDELKLYDINGFLLETEVLKGKQAENDKNIQIITEDLAVAKKAYEQAHGDFEQAEEKISELDLQITANHEQIRQENVLYESLKGQIGLLEEQIHTEQSNREHAISRIAVIDEEIEKRRQEKKEFVLKKGEINEKLDALDDEITEAEEELETSNEKLAELEAQISAGKSKIIAIMNEKADLGAKRQHFETLYDQNKIRKSEIAARLLKFKSEEAEQQAVMTQLKNNLTEVDQALAAANDKVQSLEKQLNDKRNEQSDLERRLNTTRQEYHGQKSRYETMRNLAERYEGYGSSVKAVMELRSTHKGIIGSVADLIETSKKYEVAIETALGGAIQNIVTDTEETAKKLIEHLKRNRAGRATFLPLSAIDKKNSFGRDEALKENGALGTADSLVTTKKGYEHLATYLLGRILVVDEIDHAIAIARKYRYSFRIVTLEGELLNAGGSMTGGAYKNNSNLLGRKRELEELQQKMAASEALTQKLTEDIDVLRKSLVELTQKRNMLRMEAQDLQVKKAQAESACNNHQIRMDEFLAQEKELRSEAEKLADMMTKVEESRGALNTETKSLDKENKVFEKEVAKLEEKIARLKEDKDEAAKYHAKLQVEFANLSQTDGFLMENMKRINSEVDTFEEEKLKLQGGMGNFLQAIEEKEARIAATKVEMQSHLEQVKTLEGQIKTIQENREQWTVRRRDLLKLRDEGSEQINRLDKEAYRLDAQRERYSEQMQGYIDYLWNEYELTPVAAREYRHPDYQEIAQVRKVSQQLKQSIKELGHVNVNAIEEYKEVSDRYTFLKGQHDDLIHAEENLKKIIEELENGMREQFMTQFAEIKKEFNRVFKELFGGGTGTLELMDGDDILTCGINIIAQPPGKKLQNMMQLSGGEKALTAICLLFAILNLKPSPFCLLDEIEAALDDANVVRYADYLNKLKEDTQFIVITHRRGTMVAADRLYGITMQEKGISTLVAVDLIEESVLK